MSYSFGVDHTDDANWQGRIEGSAMELALMTELTEERRARGNNITTRADDDAVRPY
jgi:hypothetical protein